MNPESSQQLVQSLSLRRRLQAFDLPAGEEFAAITQWQQDSNQHTFLLKASLDWSVFAGHFPGRPILAGIIQVHWAVQFAHVFLGLPTAPLEIKQLKFRNVFVPPGCLQLNLNHHAANLVEFNWRSQTEIPEQLQVHAQGKLLYEP